MKLKYQLQIAKQELKLKILNLLRLVVELITIWMDSSSQTSEAKNHESSFTSQASLENLVVANG